MFEKSKDAFKQWRQLKRLEVLTDLKNQQLNRTVTNLTNDELEVYNELISNYYLPE
jgi:Mg/Co/Ni transporter MgtE